MIETPRKEVGMLAAEIFGNGFAFTVGVVSGMSLYGGVQIVRCLRGDDDRGWIELAGSVGLMIGCGAMYCRSSGAWSRGRRQTTNR